VVVGGALGIVQARGRLRGVALPRRIGGSALVWILVATAGGILLAGLTLPPGYLGHITADSYDILEYHVQLPREFFEAGRVSTLGHNIYSHYPLSSEMLFLLGMCLRGSAYQGIYLCQMMNGLLAVVAVLAVFGLAGMPAAPGARPTSFPPEVEDDLTARFGVALLATSPWVIYLSGLAMEEIGQIAFAALALVWLKYWLARPSMKAGLLLGVLLGSSCCFKYLSVGLVAAPVLAVMLLLALRRKRQLLHWLAAAVMSLVVFSPG